MKLKIIFIGSFLLALLGTLFSPPIQAQKTYFERGLAEITEDGLNTGKNLGLHRSLKIGTEIGVRNPANGQTIKVKIVGRLPNTGMNEKIILKVSEAAYKNLRASGKRFAVELFKSRSLSHKVLKGETLYAISRKYGVSVDEVKTWNHLETDTLSIGQQLKIIRNP